MGNYSTERLIFTCPLGCVLAHSWRLMPHNTFESYAVLHIGQWRSTVDCDIVPPLFAAGMHDIWKLHIYF